MAGTSPAMTRKERTDAMIDLETELQALTPEDGCRLYAQRLQLWRLCERVSCRRAGACGGDPLGCCRRFADWAEARSSKRRNAIAMRATPRSRA